MTYPAVRDAGRDRALAPSVAQVYLYLTGRLSVDAFVALSSIEVSSDLGIHRETAAAALHTLIERGYIDVHSGGPGRANEYRLRYARKTLCTVRQEPVGNSDR